MTCGLSRLDILGLKGGGKQLDQLLRLAGIFQNQGDHETGSASLELDVILVTLDLDTLGLLTIDKSKELFDFVNLLRLLKVDAEYCD